MELRELFEVAGFGLVEHRFGLVTPNQSGLIRRKMVEAMYRMFPSLMPTQVAIFQKLTSSNP
jgi:Ca2+-binding EF-hand superfamily protein